MSLLKIDEIYVYTSSTQDPVGTHELHAWFDHSAIPHIKLDYKDVNQITEVLTALNTWWSLEDLDVNRIVPALATEFPLIVYTELYSDKPVSYFVKKYIQGKNNIIAQLPELYNLGR